MTLLLVSITPSFFRSPACRGEVERFLAREHELGRQDLILPVYYVSTPELRESLRQHFRVGRTLQEQLAEAVANEQYEQAAAIRDELNRRNTGAR